MSFIDILSKVELLIHFGTTILKHAKDIKQALETNGIDDADYEDLTEQEETELQGEGEQEEEPENCRPFKKRKAFDN